MNGTFEFRVLLYYLGAIYFFPAMYWRKPRHSPPVVGVPSSRQIWIRRIATILCVVPIAYYVLDGPWSWHTTLGIPILLRWSTAIPATLSILLMIWASRQIVIEPELWTLEESPLPESPLPGSPQEKPLAPWTFIHMGPYAAIRHPLLLASSVFFLSLAFLSDNGFIVVAVILAALLVRLGLVPAVEADMERQFGSAYAAYRAQTGVYLPHLGQLPQAEYTVPRRFGLFPVLALTTIFAILFGGLNYMHAPPLVYMFVSTEISAICIVQILFGSTARSASAIIGAILLPFWVAISFVGELGKANLLLLIVGGVALMPPGAVLGYFIGTLAAGFFLAMDLLEPYLPGAKAAHLDPLATKSEQSSN